MNSSRESIYAALFSLVSNASDLLRVFVRLRLKQGRKLGRLHRRDETEAAALSREIRGIPPKYTMRADITIYAFNPDQSQPATPQLNSLVDAVEAALAPSPVTSVQSLGGLVSHCFISGKTDYFDGVLGSQAIAVIPIEILTT